MIQARIREISISFDIVMDIFNLHIFQSHLLDAIANIDYVHLSHHVLAQTFEEVDILADIEDAWYNFVDTGQCWALVIGVVVGYGFKGLTNY